MENNKKNSQERDPAVDNLWLDAYFSSDLPPDERERVEERLDQDERFKRSYQTFDALYRLAEKRRLLQQSGKGGPERQRRGCRSFLKQKGLWSAAAGLAMLTFVGLLAFDGLPGSVTEQIAFKLDPADAICPDPMQKNALRPLAADVEEEGSKEEEDAPQRASFSWRPMSK